MNLSSQTDPWKELAGHCACEVLGAPKTWGDPLRPSSIEIPQNLEGIVTYLRRNVVGHPWANHLALLAVVLYSQHLQYKSVFGTLSRLHSGFSDLFATLNLRSMADWDVDGHMTLYLGGHLLNEHTSSQRANFWRCYVSSSMHLKRWLTGLPAGQQAQYLPYILPYPHDSRELARLSGGTQVALDQQEKRKADTDALMPFYMDLRTQAHLRYNLLVRIRKAYRKAIQAVESGKGELPFEFEMREGGKERLVFRLWDRRAFVLGHAELFSHTTQWDARHRQRAYTPTKNAYLLEFVRAEALDGSSPVAGLWFLELLEHRVLGEIIGSASPEEVEAKQTWLRAQGYAEDEGEQAEPFQPETSGLLLPTKVSGDGPTIRHFRERTGAIFIPVEPFFTAATFGMVALHILTANGMRISELQQLRATSECIVPIVLPPAPSASDQTPTVHWEARVVPKGHRTPKPYYFDDEHLRLLSLVKYMLCEQYGINPQTGGDLPVVSLRGDNAHRSKPDRYLFQYEHRALSQVDLRVCMRFLVHGLVFQTLDGRKVTVRPHLLRHGFATWALNVAKEPVDIVGAILHQRNLDVTKYYGRPNPRLIAERSHGLMTQISSYIDVDELILRSPEEIQQMLLKAQTTHGTLARVRGGRCLVSGECPIFFACIGCAAKAPDPAQREEVEEVKQVTLIQIGKARRKGLSLEVIQLEKKLTQCDAELREMEMMEVCRQDEQREPEVNFDLDT